MNTARVASVSLALLFVFSAAHAEDAPKTRDTQQKNERKSMQARLTKGYTSVSKEGETYYCRRHIALGSRLPTRVCYTMEQLVELDRQRQLDQQKIGTKQVQRPTDDRCNAARCGP